MRARAIGRRERGAVLVITAGALTTLLIFASIAVDLGYQRVARRDMQALADLVALDVVRLVDGRSQAEIEAGDAENPSLVSAVATSVARNDDTVGDEPDVTAELGTVDGDNVFSACSVAAPCTPPTAVKVTASTKVDYFLGTFVNKEEGGATRTAVAVRSKENSAAFLVGSSLVSVNAQSSSVIGQILGSVIPGASVLSYQGLANANISLEDLGIALDIPLTAMSPDELLDTEVTLYELVAASAQAAQAGGNQTAAVTALNDLLAVGVPPTTVNLGEALGVSAGDAGPVITGTVSIASLLTSAVFLIDGEHAITIPRSTVGIPGIGDVAITLAGIEGPLRGGDGEGASRTTQQIHLEITPQIEISGSQSQKVCDLPSSERTLLGQLLGPLLGLVNCLLAPLLTRVIDVQVNASPTISVDVAQVTATQHIDCPNQRLQITPTPSILRTTADIDAAVSVAFAGGALNLLQIHVPLGATSTGSATTQTFNAVDPGTPSDFGYIWETFNPTSSQVGADPLGLGGLLTIGPTTVTVLNTNLSVLGGIARTLLANLLNPVLEDLDTLLLQPLAELLGLNLGGTDLTPIYLRCDQSSVALVG